MKYLPLYTTAALLASTAPQAYAQNIGVNYANGNRDSAATQTSTIAAMQANGVYLARIPLENYWDNYAGTINAVKTAAAAGIAVHLNIAISSARAAALYPPGTVMRPADPNNGSIYSAYPLSALSPALVASVLGSALRRIDALGIKLEAIEFGNELGNPSFNGDIPLVGLQGGVVLSLNDLIEGRNTETQAIAAGLRNYVAAVAQVTAIRDSLLYNSSTPIVSAGLNTPADAPAGWKTGILEDEVALNDALYYMRANGLDLEVDEYGVHAYLWGSQAQIHNLNATLIMGQCGASHPCAVTEWGWQVSNPGTCPANDGPRQVEDTYYRADMRPYAAVVSSLIYYDWKSPSWGIYLCGALTGSGQIALQP